MSSDPFYQQVEPPLKDLLLYEHVPLLAHEKDQAYTSLAERHETQDEGLPTEETLQSHKPLVQSHDLIWANKLR